MHRNGGVKALCCQWQAGDIALGQVNRLVSSLGPQTVHHAPRQVNTRHRVDVLREGQCDSPRSNADFKDAAGAGQGSGLHKERRHLIFHTGWEAPRLVVVVNRPVKNNRV